MKKRWSEKEAAWQVEEGGEVPAGRPLGVGPAGGAGPGVASHSPSLQAPHPRGRPSLRPPGEPVCLVGPPALGRRAPSSQPLHGESLRVPGPEAAEWWLCGDLRFLGESEPQSTDLGGPLTTWRPLAVVQGRLRPLMQPEELMGTS